MNQPSPAASSEPAAPRPAPAAPATDRAVAAAIEALMLNRTRVKSSQQQQAASADGGLVSHHRE